MSSGEQSTSRPRQKRIAANGVEFEILEAGSGPLALCLHGFPDSAHTWRYLLPKLAQAGFRAVAPFMRGYAPTGLAPDGCYQLDALVADAIALHEALDGDARAVLIGSDWGAEAAYGAAAAAPDRWNRLVTIGVPPLALDKRLFSDYDQLKRFFYLFFMRTQFAESVLSLNGMAFIDRLWEDWCPGYEAREDLGFVKLCLGQPENLSAAIGYYRAEEPALEQIGLAKEHAVEQSASRRRAPQPTLYLHGERDGCIDVSLISDAERHLSPGSKAEIIEGAGHFLQVERPDLANDRIVMWLQSG